MTRIYLRHSCAWEEDVTEGFIDRSILFMCASTFFWEEDSTFEDLLT